MTSQKEMLEVLDWVATLGNSWPRLPKIDSKILDSIRTCISEYFRMKEEIKNLKYLSGNWLNNSLVFKPSDLCRGAEKILTRIRDYGKEADDE